MLILEKKIHEHRAHNEATLWVGKDPQENIPMRPILTIPIKTHTNLKFFNSK